jgi:Glycopeptide antibiotics resistance protein
LLKDWFLINGDLIADGTITWTAFVAVCAAFLVAFAIKRKKPLYFITFIVFFIYLHMLFVLLFYPFPITKSGLELVRITHQPPYFNIIPFHSIVTLIWRAIQVHFDIIPALKNILGNIIAFMPFGFLFPCLAPSFTRLKKCLWLSFLVPLGVELTQLAGSLALQAVWKFADIDDVILNMAGILLGWLILKWFLRLAEKTVKVNFLSLINGGKAAPEKA